MGIDVERWEGPFHILALDGGGIKGLFSVAFLAKLEDKLGVRIVDHFDLIAGTSTGGIIALALGLGLPLRQVVEFYVKDGPAIFMKPGRLRRYLGFWRPKYTHDKLKEVLASSHVFDDMRLGDSTKRLVIPAYNLDQDEPRVFKTPHHPRLTTDLEIPAWQVALATSAAPTYFPACCKTGRPRFIDGGMWANNPSVVAIAEAVSVLKARLDQVSVLSIGTTDVRKARPHDLDNGGIFHWLKREDIVDVFTRGQTIGMARLAQHLVGEDHVTRINPVVPDGLYDLDDANPDDLLAEAEHRAMESAPRVEELFLEYMAQPYTPYSPRTR